MLRLNFPLQAAFKKQREEGSDIDPEIVAQSDLMRAALKK